MFMILRALLMFAGCAGGIYVLIYLLFMTPYFNKRRNKRIARRVIMGLAACAITALLFGLYLNLVE